MRNLIFLALVLVLGAAVMTACQTDGDTGSAVEPQPGPVEPTEEASSDVPGRPGRDEPSEPGRPAPRQPAQGAADFQSALTQLGSDTQFVRLEFVREQCGDIGPCLNEVERVEEYMRELCPSTDNCPNDVARVLMFGPAPSNAQRQAGICPSTGCVQIRELRTVAQEALSADPGAGAAGAEGPAAPDFPRRGDVAREASQALGNLAAEQVDWDQLSAAVIESNPELERELPEFRQYIEGLVQNRQIERPGLEQVAEDLLGGSTAATGDVLDLMDYLAERPER